MLRSLSVSRPKSELKGRDYSAKGHKYFSYSPMQKIKSDSKKNIVKINFRNPNNTFELKHNSNFISNLCYKEYIAWKNCVESFFSSQ